MGKIYKGDTGTLLLVYTGIDLSGVITCAIKVKKPDGSSVVWNGAPYGDPTDGIIVYITQEGDIDQSGVYCANAYVETAAGKWTGETFKFVVADVCQ